MRTAIKLLGAGVALAALATVYAYAGSSTLSLPSGPGTARVGTDGSGYFFGNNAICDGAACANLATVKGASTAAAATDPALVVAVSPNNTVSSLLTQGGSVLSTTNGIYTNLLQGNAALSATNGIYANLLQGNSANASGNPFFAQLTAGSANIGHVDGEGTAGTPSGGVVSVQGVAGGTALNVNGSFSATGFTPSGNYSTPLTASTSTSNVALPTGSPSTIMVYNTGANSAYINLGTTSGVTATTSGIFLGGGAAMPLNVGSNTYLAAITASGTTTINIAGGSGLGTASGGAGIVLNTNGNITPGDGITTGQYGAASPVIGSSLLWNGTTYDRAKEGPVTGSTLVSPNTLSPIEKAALSNSAVSVKASAGWLQALNCDNANTGSVIVEFFNTSSVTLGTTAPVWHVAIPSGGGGSNIPAPINLGGSAIYIAAVTAYNGSTAPSTTLNCAVGYL